MATRKQLPKTPPAAAPNQPTRPAAPVPQVRPGVPRAATVSPMIVAGSGAAPNSDLRRPPTSPTRPGVPRSIPPSVVGGGLRAGPTGTPPTRNPGAQVPAMPEPQRPGVPRQPSVGNTYAPTGAPPTWNPGQPGPYMPEPQNPYQPLPKSPMPPAGPNGWIQMPKNPNWNAPPGTPGSWWTYSNAGGMQPGVPGNLVNWASTDSGLQATGLQQQQYMAQMQAMEKAQMMAKLKQQQAMQGGISGVYRR